MIIGVKYEMGDLVDWPRNDIPKPLIVLTCPEWSLANQSRVVKDYQAWLWVMLRLCRQKGFYAVVQLPVQFLGTAQLTDYNVRGFLGLDQDELTVYAVYLMQGHLATFDYYLRVYSLLRKGLTLALIADDRRSGLGGYAATIRDATVCEWSQVVPVESVLSVLGRWVFDSKTPFMALVLQATYLRREWLWWRLLSLLSVLRKQRTRRLKSSISQLDPGIRSSL